MSTQYALLKDGVFVEYRFFKTAPEVAAHKGYSALPVEYEKVDNSTQDYTTSVIENIIEPSRYLIRTTISDMSPAEIAAAQENTKTAVVSTFDTDLSFTRALALTLFDAVNEIRALKSQAPLTFAQFKTYVKGKL